GLKACLGPAVDGGRLNVIRLGACRVDVAIKQRVRVGRVLDNESRRLLRVGGPGSTSRQDERRRDSASGLRIGVDRDGSERGGLIEPALRRGRGRAVGVREASSEHLNQRDCRAHPAPPELENEPHGTSDRFPRSPSLLTKSARAWSYIGLNMLMSPVCANLGASSTVN